MTRHRGGQVRYNAEFRRRTPQGRKMRGGAAFYRYQRHWTDS